MKFKNHRRHGKGRSSPELAILYEDESVIAVNKPAGLLTVPVKGSDPPSALSLVSANLKDKRQRAFIVHRIDRFSSGILLFAKTQPDRDTLIRQFLSHSPLRQYLAVVRGHLNPAEGTLIHYFRKQRMFQKLSQKGDPRAVRAALQYSMQQPLRGASLVLVTLITGLQNQIRVQFSAIGHPVIGDRKYSPREAEERRISRVALHAAHLEFIHPRSGKSISIDCEPPSDFQSLVQAMSLSRRRR